MKRAELRSTIAAACEAAGTAPEDTARLVATADAVDQIAVGDYWREDKQCGCPATVAGYFVPTAAGGRSGWVPSTPPAVQKFPFHFDMQDVFRRAGWVVPVED